MPKTKMQGIIFGVIMAYAMTFGMEMYNNAFNMGGVSAMSGAVLVNALKETTFMGLLVIIISSLWGNKAGARFAAKHCDPTRDNPYFCRLMRQAGTIAFMCPAMSLAATLLFNYVLGHAALSQLPFRWLGTLLRNVPMAFFWNLFAAAPFTHWLVQRLFQEERVCVTCALPLVGTTRK